MKISVTRRGVDVDNDGRGHPYETHFEVKDSETVQELAQRLLTFDEHFSGKDKNNYYAHIEIRTIKEVGK